jgi:hypothetical protein
MTNFNCCYHFVSPGIHGFFPFRKTFGNYWFRIEFLHNTIKQNISTKKTISKRHYFVFPTLGNPKQTFP